VVVVVEEKEEDGFMPWYESLDIFNITYTL